jgi:DNA-binding NtrC family response regulator
MKPSNETSLPVLVIDDEESILLSIDTTLQLAGIANVITCSDSRQAMTIIERKQPGVILLDLNMPYMDGESILEMVSAEYPQIPVIIITGRIDADTAVSCIKSGAFDYLVKPVDENRLVASVRKSIQYMELQQENLTLKKQLAKTDDDQIEAFKDIITCSPKMLMLFNYAASISQTTQPVLIRGETGTGKELIARAIHRLSGRSGAFVAVNVAGLDDNVFSDTLFGHTRGAFTGADSNRGGLIERAADGTLFLDEIGDLNSNSQIKLLRLLQENEYLPIGQDEPKISSARIIASTHVDLWELQAKELFRQDLHYRLRTHRILLPPLRKRKEDLGLLVSFFIQKSAHSLGKKTPIFPKELLPLLETFHFPGNIRELQAMVFDGIAQNDSTVVSLSSFRNHIARIKHLEGKSNIASSHSLPFTFGDPLPSIKEATRMLIEEALERAGNNQTIAATMLGISQQALSKRLKSMDSLE